MDCCRTARRLGGEDVKVIVRSPFETMKASPWEKEDAMHEGIPIIDNHVPKSFVIEGGRLVGMTFEKVEAVYDEKGKRSLVPTGEPDAFYPADDVLIAVGQENAFPWIERDLGIEFDEWEMPVVDRVTFQSTNPRVYFGGDAAFGPENVITAVAHGHQAGLAAGNGGVDLDTVVNPAGQQIFNRSSPDFLDSGAILIGAASSAAPHSRLGFSCHGSRIDCYGWGENVDTLSSDSTNTATDLYTTGFSGTSSASYRPGPAARSPAPARCSSTSTP